MQPKHTPGPWALTVRHEEKSFDSRTGEPRPPGAYIRIAAESDEYGWVHSCYANHSNLEEQLANGRLIASSPEMLDALHNVIGIFEPKECNCDGEYTQDGIVGHACYFHRIEELVKAAIRKAEGK